MSKAGARIFQCAAKVLESSVLARTERHTHTHTRANTKYEVRVLIEFFVRPEEPEDSVE